MMEKEITQLIGKFEKVMGPVARTVANDAAKELRILKDERISPSSRKDYELFTKLLMKRYGKIIGDRLAQNIMGV